MRDPKKRPTLLLNLSEPQAMSIGACCSTGIWIEDQSAAEQRRLLALHRRGLLDLTPEMVPGTRATPTVFGMAALTCYRSASQAGRLRLCA